MLRSLYSKLAAVLTGLFLIVGILFVIVIVFSTGMYQQEVNQKLNSQLAEQIVAEKILMNENQVNEEALEDIFHMLMVLNPSIEIYLLNTGGKILAFSAPEEKVKLKRVDLAPIKRWLEGDMTIPLMGDDPRDPERKKVFTAAPIREQGRLAGYLYVILGGEIYDGVVQKIKASYILQLSAWVIFASLLFALITGLILFAVLTGRLNRLAKVMDTFKRDGSSKQLGLPIKKTAYAMDEIDRLGFTFQEMAEHIDEQIEKLKESDALRRELIANVSHDLRTPLATLQGYLETLILKEKDLSETERHDYIKTTINHCNRLSRLVNQLIELAKLESLQVILNKEPFSLGELVQDVLQKFQLSASKKQIDLFTNNQEGLPYVNADIGLIERALENLIENSLHYTPKGGIIRVNITPLVDNLSVQIDDTGTGIPQDELPYIFDRFYQSNKSRKSPSGHAGLGLAITKKILELHSQSIEVTSSPGKGSTFSFRLPLFHSV